MKLKSVLTAPQIIADRKRAYAGWEISLPEFSEPIIALNSYVLHKKRLKSFDLSLFWWGM